MTDRERVSFKSGKVNLHGYLYLPGGSGSPTGGMRSSSPTDSAEQWIASQRMRPISSSRLGLLMIGRCAPPAGLTAGAASPSPADFLMAAASQSVHCPTPNEATHAECA